ncbi:uncharacterized protein LOC119689896 [Teleopsis dalmanni]|uniref:uncharacterized protein LOC119689896 n=1 Tax=Teleopsis dalmanni TaxID=139649 RepID=UPI0018CE9E7B|nr:uncharacterized protein LOC119689896 [Teleopsis dalmanni]
MSQVEPSNNSALDRNNIPADCNVSNDYRNEQPRGDICRIGIKAPAFYSENRKLRRLVQECQLGDSKPTHLLRTMRDLASGAMNDGAIKQLWLDRLPEAVRAVVSISEADLDKCAQQAGLMLEMGNYNSVAVINTSAQNNDHIMKAIDALSKQVAELKTAQRRSRTRSQTPDRKRHHSTRTDSQVKRYPMCYYHYRFGVEAKKCSLPCSFNQQGNQ